MEISLGEYPYVEAVPRGCCRAIPSDFGLHSGSTHESQMSINLARTLHLAITFSPDNFKFSIHTSKMKTAPAALASLAALLTCVQQSPAPVNVVIPAVLGGVGAGFAGKAFKEFGLRDERPIYRRDDDPFAGLPQPAADQCKSQLQGVTVTFSPLDNNGVRVDDVPSSCMTLANVFLDDDSGDSRPIPMGMFISTSPTLAESKIADICLTGSASLEYHNLSTDQLKQLQDALDQRQGN